MKTLRISDHTFFPDLIRPGSTVLDCGANHGTFSLWVATHTTAQVHAFEPTPALFSTLPDLPRFTKHPEAIYREDKVLNFTLSINDQASTLRSQESAPGKAIAVQAVRLEDFCSRVNIRDIDLVKLDIEGSEIDVLKNATDSFLRSIRQITVEFHDFLHPEDVPAIKEISGRLRSLGFYGFKVSLHDYADVLFVNETLCPLSAADKLIVSLDRYRRGILRILVRRILVKLFPNWKLSAS